MVQFKLYSGKHHDSGLQLDDVYCLADSTTKTYSAMIANKFVIKRARTCWMTCGQMLND